MATGQQVTDPTSGFQVMRAEIARLFARDVFPVDYPDADILILLHRTGYRVRELPVQMRPSPGSSMHSSQSTPYYVYKMLLSICVTLMRPRTKGSPMISWNLRIIGMVGSLALLAFIFELVRRRQLKEEYTVLWVLTAVVLFVLAAWEGLLSGVRNLIGAGSEASTLYFFGLIFVVALLMYFSVRVSRLERRVIAMMQEIALLGAAARNGKHNGAGAPEAAEAHAAGAARAPRRRPRRARGLSGGANREVTLDPQAPAAPESSEPERVARWRPHAGARVAAADVGGECVRRSERGASEHTRLRRRSSGRADDDHHGGARLLRREPAAAPRRG